VKGIDILIDAIARLHAEGHPVTATLVGSGPDEAALKAQVQRRSLQHAIRFMAAMPARKALTLGRIMAVPSRAESLPYVVLETAAAGKPLVTTNVGGIPEIFGPLSDALIEPGNTGALADAIARALDNPEAATRLAAELRLRVQSSFSVDAMVDGVVCAYREAMEEAIPVQNAALAPK
jgi:glycosyltransferase involved in cell wall biosynthesis